MDESASYMPVSSEAKSLSPDDLAALAEHLARYSQVYQVSQPHEKLNLEDLALSSLKIDRFDKTINLLKDCIRREALPAWDSILLTRLSADQNQFTGPRCHPRHATVRTSQLASEIADRWQLFADYVSKSKKHILPIDQIIALLDFEGLPHSLHCMNSRALWFTAHFLAHNPRKDHFINLWLQIDKIKDPSTVIEQINDVVNAMPDQAKTDQILLDHALARVEYWQSQAKSIETESDIEKQIFFDTFQGTRLTREHLRFQLTCRRHEVSQNTRLRRVMERMCKASRQAISANSRQSSVGHDWLSSKPRPENVRASAINETNPQENPFYNLIEQNYQLSEDDAPVDHDEINQNDQTLPDTQPDIAKEELKSIPLNNMSPEVQEPAPANIAVSVRFSESELKRIQQIYEDYVNSLSDSERQSPELLTRLNDPDFMVNVARKMYEKSRDQARRVGLSALVLNQLSAPDTGQITMAHLAVKSQAKGHHLKKSQNQDHPKLARDLPKRLFHRDHARPRPPD